MVDEMPLGGYALGGQIYGGYALGGKAPAKKQKKLVHQGNEKVAELKKKAKALGIKGYSKMRKFELLKAVRDREDNKSHPMVKVEQKPKKHVKRSAKNFTDRQCLEILEIADVLKMKLAELKKRL
jgi:hypothetical protein